MPKIRTHLSYANVVASLALFLAIGGGAAYAATHLAKSSVGPGQLKRNAVTSAKVRDGSLLSADFKAGQLSAGPKGEPGQPGQKGEPGPQGAPGISGYVQVDAFSALDSASPKSAVANCPPGTTVIGGGAFINNGGSNEAVAVGETGPESGDAAEATSWIGEAFEAIPTAQTWAIDVRAICAKVAP